ncbi:Myb/SANT-like DNA-binding domain [Phytophthora infestans]|uniref:Myb/SANT-like DNA-binding domain n=1 Tax=Phytophthora infestans TaxID=4787 RepID=A0A833SJ83_PHYIN|nr:Myb/SANT-like DNA-binding domain [Phytophthora infestans]KAF4137044.1 Myb/SANT-like DNA-binding domain [Phytophthora infestans]
MSARSSSAAARASWDLDMDVFLVEAMTDQEKAGKRADSGFKKEAWVAVHESMNERFNKELTIQQIKTRVQTLKSKYTTISHMLRVSGFGWDTNHNVVLVHDDVWDRYVSEHPKAINFRKKAVPYYEDLVDLFEGTYATGEHALSSDEPIDFDTDTNVPEVRGEFTASTGDSNPAPAPPTLPNEATATSATSTDRGDLRGGNKNDSHQKGSRKRNRESGGALIADAINDVATEMRNRTARMKTLTPSQKAIKVLQKTYAERFSAFEMAQAFDVMLDENKARLFVVMEEGEVRDIWLANQVSSSD